MTNYRFYDRFYYAQQFIKHTRILYQLNNINFILKKFEKFSNLRVLTRGFKIEMHENENEKLYFYKTYDNLNKLDILIQHDGLIFQPTLTNYKNRDIYDERVNKFKKWKPAELNTVDLHVFFQKLIN